MKKHLRYIEENHIIYLELSIICKNFLVDRLNSFNAIVYADFENVLKLTHLKLLADYRG